MARPLSTSARAKMLTAATDLMLSVGVHGVTIDEVARRSGVAKTTIYRHFASKNELIIASLDANVSSRLPEAPDTGSLRGDVLLLLERVLPSFADPMLRAVFLGVVAASAHDPELHDIHQSMSAGQRSPLTEVVQRWQARGEISLDIDIPTAFGFIEGPFVIRSLLWPETLHGLDLEMLVDQILGALAPSGPQSPSNADG